MGRYKDSLQLPLHRHWRLTQRLSDRENPCHCQAHNPTHSRIQPRWLIPQKLNWRNFLSLRKKWTSGMWKNRSIGIYLQPRSFHKQRHRVSAQLLVRQLCTWYFRTNGVHPFKDLRSDPKQEESSDPLPCRTREDRHRYCVLLDWVWEYGFQRSHGVC